MFPSSGATLTVSLPILRRNAFTLIVLLLLLLFFVLEQNTLLQFSREEISNGEWWRFLSAHFIHLNFHHLLLNAGVFLGFGFAVGSQLKPWVWAACTLLLAWFISIALFILSPDVAWYVGFSGVLHGLLIVGLLLGVLRSGDIWFLLVLLALVVKLAREQLPSFNREHLSDWIGAPVVVDAHLYGAAAGLLFALVIFTLEKYFDPLHFSAGDEDDSNAQSNESRET